MKKSPVVHFEMGYNDRERMKQFYASTFGWTMQQYGEDMGNYVVAQTGETDEKGMLKNPGQINGGFYAKSADPSSQAPSFVIAVENIQDAMKMVEANGGKLLGAMNPAGERQMDPMEIPGVGLWMSFEDTEGNRVSLLQPNPRS